VVIDLNLRDLNSIVSFALLHRVHFESCSVVMFADQMLYMLLQLLLNLDELLIPGPFISPLLAHSAELEQVCLFHRTVFLRFRP
jgi:hypothetical protein